MSTNFISKLQLALSLIIAVCRVSTAEASSLVESYSYDGSNNNLKQPFWGAANTTKIRSYPPNNGYTDQLSTPYTSNLPSARRVMAELFNTAPPKKDKQSNQLLLELGHFIVHDIMKSWGNSSEPFPIPCDGQLRDLLFCPVLGGKLDFSRAASRQMGASARAPMNFASSFLDLSNIYGNDEETVQLIRGGLSGGELALEDNLPQNHPVHFERQLASPGLFALKTVFMRYHNLKAREHARRNPSLKDDDLFELARMDTIAVYQSIVEEKYVPELLGEQLEEYQGYNPDVDPAVDVFFATVSFRYGHSSMSNIVRVLDKEFRPTPMDPILLMNAMPDLRTVIQSVGGGVEPFLRGLTMTPSKAVDASIDDALNIWNATSMIDIQRSRDVGIPSYNDVREAFGLERKTNWGDLVGNDTGLIPALINLYGDIDEMDAYVGALIEQPLQEKHHMGPIITQSIKDQFTRLRDGDRLWYKYRYPKSEYESFPTMSEVIKAVWNETDEMTLFPEDSFALVDYTLPAVSKDVCSESQASFSLLSGTYTGTWVINDPSTDRYNPNRNHQRRTIDMTLTFKEEMQGAGFIGIGWGSKQMKGAEIWFCTVDMDELAIYDKPETCSSTEDGGNSSMVSCCLAPGKMYRLPQCNDPYEKNYTLHVLNWCLSLKETSITVRVVICDNSDANSNDCFRIQSGAPMDFIAAYNPFELTKHPRRSFGEVDLYAAGTNALAEETEPLNVGVFATHGSFMLIAWMVCAPCAIFIVRYLKTHKWRMFAHELAMGACGTMMIPLIFTAESATGASDKTAPHSIVGKVMAPAYACIVLFGSIVRVLMEGKKKGLKAKVGKTSHNILKRLHKCGGWVLLMLSWYNCYTGLVRICPGTDSVVEVTIFSSFSLGYDIQHFAIIRDYVFWIYGSIVVLVFGIAELYKRINSSSHLKRLQEIADGSSRILGDDMRLQLEKMTMSTFLELTRHGSQLCIVDGVVLDIGEFMDFHPGGASVLSYAQGSDITKELLGKQDVDEITHAHSAGAFQLLEEYATAVLDTSSETDLDPESSQVTITGAATLPLQISDEKKLYFRRAKVTSVAYVTPALASEYGTNHVILVRLSLPEGRNKSRNDETLLPGSDFTFRVKDDKGTLIERKYTPLHLDVDYKNMPYLFREKKNEGEVYDFLISLHPLGKMSEYLLGIKTGKQLLVQGPEVRSNIFNKISMRVLDEQCKSVVMFAAGTGIAPMLQIIDYYLATYAARQESFADEGNTSEERLNDCNFGAGSPKLYLVWVLSSPKHNYLNATGIRERAKRSQGMFKWVVIYSSRNSKSLLEEGPSLIDPQKGSRSMWKYNSKKGTVENLINLSRKASTKIMDSMDIGNNNHGNSTGEVMDFWSIAGTCIQRRFDYDLMVELFAFHTGNVENKVFVDLAFAGKNGGTSGSVQPCLLVPISGPGAFVSSVLENLQKLELGEKEIIVF